MPNDKPLLGKKIAVLVETEYIYDELKFYQERIPQLGGELTILAYLWGKPSIDIVNDIDSPDRLVTDVHRLTVAECVSRHDPNEFDIVICAANYVAVRLREIQPIGSLGSPELTRSAPAVDFFARAMNNKSLLKAAMCHALWILTPRPDLLKGRRIICHTVVLADIHNAGAIYIPAPGHVVVDDDLVTARSFADIEAYFDAIVTVAQDRLCKVPTPPSADLILRDTVTGIKTALKSRFNNASVNFHPNYRPVAKAAAALIEGTLNVATEVRRVTGVDFDEANPVTRKPLLFLASKFGTWASELTVVAGVLLRAGYKVKVATEDGSPPHLLGPSLDPTFEDGAWRSSVVSTEERDLASKFLDPKSREHELLRPGSIYDLRNLARPPQIGDYLHDPAVLDRYEEALCGVVGLARDYDAIIIAGGSGAIPGFMADRGIHALILAFHNLGKPVMAECNGGLAVAQTIDPNTGKSILNGKAVTTHSFLDEYQAGWGWTSAFNECADDFWKDGSFDLAEYQSKEQWISPGLAGNPMIDSEALFRNAAGPDGIFVSPPGTPYSVVIDENLITCRTTPDGYPGVLALIAVLDGRPALRGRMFIDSDGPGRRQQTEPVYAVRDWTGASPWEAARSGDIAAMTRWLSAGGDPDISDAEGWTPLLIAAAQGRSDIVDLLLCHDISGARRANPDLRFPGADALPIYMAGQSGDVTTVKSILRVRPGHVFDVASVNGHTVLLQAAFYGQRPHQELAVYLLESIGSILSIDPKDERAVLAERARLLTATNVRGQNPLALADAYGISPMIEVIKRFAPPLEADCVAYYRRLLRRIAPAAPRNEHEGRAQLLTDDLLNVIQAALDEAREAVGEAGVLAQQRMTSLSKVDECLSERYLELNRLGGPLQRTPLITACTGADTGDQVRELRGAIVDKLLERDANPLIHEVHAMGVNAVVRAAVWGHLYLLERFAERLTALSLADAVNERPAVNGFTALHDSVLRALTASGSMLDQYLAQITWLVRHGARVDIADHSGRTQESIAKDALADPDFHANAQQVLRALRIEEVKWL